MKKLLLSIILILGCSAHAESNVETNGIFLRIGEETVQLIKDESLNIIGYTDVLKEALKSPECVIDDVKDKTLRFPFCFAEVAGEIVSIAIKRTEDVITTPIIFINKVSSEIANLVANILQKTGNNLKSKGHNLLGGGLVAFSKGIRLADKIKDKALQLPVKVVHCISLGTTVTVRYVVRLPEKMFKQLIDMTPADGPYDSSHDPIFAGG